MAGQIIGRDLLVVMVHFLFISLFVLALLCVEFVLVGAFVSDNLFAPYRGQPLSPHDDPVGHVDKKARSAKDGRHIDGPRVVARGIQDGIGYHLCRPLGQSGNAQHDANDDGQFLVSKPPRQDAFLHCHNHAAAQPIDNLASHHTGVAVQAAANGHQQTADKDDAADDGGGSDGAKARDIVNKDAG